jgi:hypothetical protein
MSKSLVIVHSVHTEEHSGYCSDPGEYDKKTVNNKYNIPFDWLPSKFIEKYCKDEDGDYYVNDCPKFWLNLTKISKNDKRFPWLLKNALKELIDEKGNTICKVEYPHNGYCNCDDNYEKFGEPYIMSNNDSDSDSEREYDIWY